MRVRILNYDAYGSIGSGYGEINYYAEKFPLGSIHTVNKFYPDTGEVDLKYEDEDYTFAPSEYQVVEE